MRDAQPDLLAIYDAALDEVYGYLLLRCGHVQTAEDLTSETFLAAARSREPVSVPWLIGVARHKLVDHWRRKSREERALAAVEGTDAEFDPWPVQLDELVAREVLGSLATQHRMALTLRYVDDLPVRQIAELIGRTEQATETLLTPSSTNCWAGSPTRSAMARSARTTSSTSRS